MEDTNEWKIVWREIGWKYTKFPELKSTIRLGWAIENKNKIEYAWFEDGKLIIYDTMDYYPNGIYEIPLNLILELKEKNNL